MQLTFRKALSANIFSASVGFVTQAATAPLYLALLQVEAFAQWVFVNAVSSYVALALNGVFYALMNEMTVAAIRGERDRAGRIYSLGLALIATLWGSIASILVAALILGLSAWDGGFGLVLIGTLFSVAHLTQIMFDAHFRAMGRYEQGTNILTLARALDWCVALAAVAATRSVALSFLGLLIYKLLSTAALLRFLERQQGACRLRLRGLEAASLCELFARARGQLTLSAATAAAAVGPQIVVSLVFADAEAVLFNVTRTYFRLIAAVVNLLTAASWPIMSAMYAERRISELEAFLSRLLSRVIVGAGVGGALMLLAAPTAFVLLFHGKAPVDPTAMALILISVLLNSGVSIQQSLYLATNLSSHALTGSAALTLGGLFLMAILGHSLGFTTALVAQTLVDAGIGLALLFGARAAFAALRAEAPALA